MQALDLKIEWLFAFIAVAVPGYIWASTESWMTPTVKVPRGEKFFRYFVYGGLNFGIWYVAVGSDVKAQISSGNLCWKGLIILFGALVVSPAVTGGFLGYLRRCPCVRWVLRKLRLPQLDVPETAWDRAFCRETGALVCVTYRDGHFRFGKYGTGSLASSSPKTRDIYLEKTFLKKDGKLEIDDWSSGLWIKEGEIRDVEFFDLEELINAAEREETGKAVGGESSGFSRVPIAEGTHASEARANADEADPGSQGPAEATVEGATLT